MRTHVNMFKSVESKSEVYAAFQQHYDRDSRTIGYLDIAVFVVAILASYLDWQGWWIWLVMLGVIGTRVTIFVDNSNRNWAMHVIDWMEASNRDE